MKLIPLFILVILCIMLVSCQQNNGPNNVTNQPVITSFSPDSVQLGEEVVIKGHYFDQIVSNNQVYVNGTPGTVLQATDSTVRFKVGVGSTTGKITLLTGGQSTISSTNLIIYYIPWVQKTDFPTLLSTGPAINGLAMTFNSATAGYVYKSKKLWQYDPVANTWTSKADQPSAKFLNNGLCFAIGNKAYIGLGSTGEGGQLNSMTKEVWEYDMTTNVWTQKGNFPGAQRQGCFSFSVGNYGYVGGGDTLDTGTKPTKDFWQYNPQTDTWTKVLDYPGVKPIGSLGVGVQNKGYVIEGGYGSLTAPITQMNQLRVWCYDPATNTWTAKTQLNFAAGKPATSASVFELGGRAYAAVGATDTLMVGNQLQKKDFFEYDPVTDAWINKPQIGGPVRFFPVSFSVNGKGYVGMGTGNTASAKRSDFWEYKN